MTDFFISYTSADKKWAEWIAYVLEDAGYSVILQAWDFRPGSNFVLEMQQAAQKAARTIMILSPDYMKSQFASPEWATAFAADPQGLKRALIPIVVKDCNPDGLLGQIVHINLTDLDQDSAHTEILAGIRPERAKPSNRPSFPGASQVESTQTKPYPRAQEDKVVTSENVYLPKLRREPSDAEKRKFLRLSFDTIRTYFEQALREFFKSQEGLEFDFQSITAVEFTAEIFLHGKNVATCRIWQGDMLSNNGISYAEGRHTFGSNSCNEVLSVTIKDGDIALSAMMGSFGHGFEDADPKHMTKEEAAKYLWHRFVSRLER